jgi:hypothetical protein
MISVESLVQYAEELEATSQGSGLLWLKTKRQQAIDQMDAGGTYDYISTTIDGQSFSRRINATALEWFEVLQLAIQEMSGTRTKLVYSHFHSIPH